MAAVAQSLQSASTYPSDNSESHRRRLNAQHNHIKGYFGGNHAGAPVNALDPKSILEIGCGTGIWAIEMAEQYRDAQVIAIDMTQPQLQREPSNLEFRKMNVLAEWPFEEAAFDLIHSRFVLTHLPDFRGLIHKILPALKPGGIIMFEEPAEFLSFDCARPEGAPQATVDFFQVWRDFDRFRNIESNQGPKLAGVLSDTRLMSEIHSQAVPVPMGAWTADTKLNALGTGTRDNMLIAMRNLLAKLAPFGGTQEKFEAWADAISRNENKLSVDFYFVWARKKQLLLSL